MNLAPFFHWGDTTKDVMKFTKISPIRGYRIFRDFAWDTGLPELSRHNVFYGWNGSASERGQVHFPEASSASAWYGRSGTEAVNLA